MRSYFRITDMPKCPECDEHMLPVGGNNLCCTCSVMRPNTEKRRIFYEVSDAKYDREAGADDGRGSA